MSTIGRIDAVYRFPVKSMQGEQPDAFEIGADGVVGDRTWALRDVETDTLVSAKRPSWWRAMLDCTATTAGDEVEVTLPDGSSHLIGDAALTEALCALLGRDVSFEAAVRPQQGIYQSEWPEIDGLTLAGDLEFPTNLMSEGRNFVDVGALHFITTASLRALAAAAPDLVLDRRRFRPSFVIDTPDLDGYAENDWTGRRLRIGDVTLEVGDPTPRCVMTTVAQPGLDRQPAVLRTLATENRQTNDFGTFACLGAYATVVDGGTIASGATVTLD